MPWKSSLKEYYKQADPITKKKKQACIAPVGFKLIRFTKPKIEKYQNSLKKIRMHGPVVLKSKPYIGLMNKKDGEIVSCIWKDSFGEISMITHKDFRRQGFMNYLTCEVIHDVFKCKFKSLAATPMNSISLHILEKYGFEGEDQDYEFSL